MSGGPFGPGGVLSNFEIPSGPVLVLVLILVLVVMQYWWYWWKLRIPSGLSQASGASGSPLVPWVEQVLGSIYCHQCSCWIGHVPICTFVTKAIYVFSGISLDVSLKNHKGREHHMDETISWTDLVSRRFLNHIFA